MVLHKTLDNILDEIDQKAEGVTMDFNDNSWRKDVPSKPGWYFIKTNTPFDVLISIRSLLRKG